MFPHWVIKFLRYYELWGFRTEWKTNFRYRLFFTHLIIAVHIVSISVVTIVIYGYMRRFDSDILGTLNDIVKYGGALFVYWSSVIESCFKSRTKEKLWEFYKIIDARYCGHRGYKNRKYSLKFNIHLLVVIIIGILYLRQIIHSSGTKYIHVWCAHIILLTICHNRTFYYLLHLELIKNELRIVEGEVKKLSNSFKTNRRAFEGRRSLMFESFEKNRLKWIREYYGIVSKLSECVNSGFGWSNLATITFSFQIILTDLNWLYWKLYNKQRIAAIGECSAKLNEINQIN